MSSSMPPWKLLFVAVLVPFGGSFHFGYQLVVTNPTQAVFERFINDTYRLHYGDWPGEAVITLLWSGITAILMIGAMCGSVLMPFVADRLGRKRGFYVSTAVVLVGCVLSALSYTVQSFELFALIRFPIGVGLGLALGLQALYLAEVSPKRWRGATSTCTGFMLQIGVVAGSTIALPGIFGTDDLWPFMYWAELLPSVVLLLCLPFMEESPSYLLRNGRTSDAKLAIKQFHGCETVDQVEATYAELEKQLAAESHTKKMGYLDVLRHSESRRGTLVGCVVAIGMAFTGIPVVNSYATKLIVQSGLGQSAASWGNLAIGVSSLFGSFLGMVTMDRFGRRVLVIWVSVVIVHLNLLVVVIRLLFTAGGGTEPAYGWALVGVSVVFMLLFAAGPGPIAFFVTSELVNQSARSAAQGLTTLTQMFARSAILFAFLPIDRLVNPYGYLMFVVPLAVTSATLYFYLPETKLRDHAEILRDVKSLPTVPSVNDCRKRARGGSSEEDGDEKGGQRWKDKVDVEQRRLSIRADKVVPVDVATKRDDYRTFSDPENGTIVEKF